MSLTIELLPDPATNDLRLTQLAAERDSPLDRLNILHGSALQRLSTQRMLAESNNGALAAVYGFTPVDLAQAAARLGDAPERRAWPAGADLATLNQMLDMIPLERLNPGAPGISSALLRTLTDLREAALAPSDLPDGDLKTIFAAWRDVVAECVDRSSHYEDGVSPNTPDAAFREALGDAPLIVSGIYDLTRIQRLLIARVAQAASVRMLLVMPSNDPASPAANTLNALRRELNPRVIRSTIPAQPAAPDHYFSVGDPTDEADQIAARILLLGRDGVPFHRFAVLHQQGASGDDRICAALERADIPTWRIGGRQLSLTPIGHATSNLIRLLLDPDAAERNTLLDWLSHRTLRQVLVGVERRQARWEQIALDVGLARGLHQMRDRLDQWQESSPTDDVRELGHIVNDLSERSLELSESDSWSEAADILIDAFDDYLDDEPQTDSHEYRLHAAVRDIFDQLRSFDGLDMPWSPPGGLTAISRAFSARVVRDPRRLVGGVNVGAATGPARGIRYEAIFAAGVAERVFPAVGREDPLLPDEERAAINARVPDAFALQRDRADSDRHAWALMRRAATSQFTASWSRRSSATGGPARASSLIIEAASAGLEHLAHLQTEATLSEAGRIDRISSNGPSVLDASEGEEDEDWARLFDSPNPASFDLALLGTSDIDIRAVLSDLWPAAESAEHARRRRNHSRFTEFDGLLETDRLPEDWRPLERSWNASELETFVTCPYRFYLMHVVGIRAGGEQERPDRPRRDAHGRLIRQILSTWVREYEHVKADRTWFEYADQPSFMNTTARRILDNAADSGILGPPAGMSAIRNETLCDLDRARRREVDDARDGWRPVEVNLAFDNTPIRVVGGREIRFRGLIHRIDEHAGGRRRALSFFTGRNLPEVRGFVNGSSFQSVAALSALVEQGVPIAQAEVEHRSVTDRGNFVSQSLRGDSLTTRGGRNAPSDGERLRNTLAAIADQLEAGSFIVYPGNPPRDRPNCARCPVESACTAEIGLRYAHKSRQDQDIVRPLEILRRQRV